tara:strand:- start:104 stop:787 length:684 start_codon:yes stop_codon:yes gene_type:complete
MIDIVDGIDRKSIEPVEFVSVMGNDDAVCDAARVSFDKKAAGYSVDANAKLLKYLAKHNHWSPFAHCFLKFRFHAPMFIARQFQKHVIGFAWNEVSRRYVDNPPTFFVPVTLRQRPANMKQGSVSEGAVPVEGAVYEDVRARAVEAASDYRALLSKGVCPEQARMFLPQNTMTEWIWTGSLQAWSRFIQLRGDSHAQAECWPYADAVSYHLHTHFPLSMKAFEHAND